MKKKTVSIQIASKHKVVLEDLQKMIGRGRKLNDNELDRVIKSIRTNIQNDGAIYRRKDGLFNYSFILADNHLINKNDYIKSKDYCENRISYLPDENSVLEDLKLLSSKNKKIKHINAYEYGKHTNISVEIKKDDCKITVGMPRAEYSVKNIFGRLMQFLNK